MQVTDQSFIFMFVYYVKVGLPEGLHQKCKHRCTADSISGCICWCSVKFSEIKESISAFCLTRKYYPSSKQFRDPPTYTHQPSMQQKVPFSLIRCSSSKVAFCSCVEWGWHIHNIVESESDPLTRRAVDLFEKEPLKGNSEVHLHTPTKFGEDRSKDLGGDREQTDRQTNRQTDKRCSIYSMITFWMLIIIHKFKEIHIIG